jgi:SAM-dependent methyltransferase
MSAADRERWDARWRERADGPGAPEPFLVRRAAALPRGRLLDVAAGDGRNALWLLAQGFAVTAVDVSPVAIARLEAAAAAQGLGGTARAADLDAPDALAGLGPFDALVVVRFKPSPGQWGRLLAALRPGGRLLLCSFGLEQHRRHGFPLAFCLERGALEAELVPALRLLDWQGHEEGGTCLEGSLWEKAPAAAAIT